MHGFYSFQFPEYLIPEGSAIIIYGAHDMGRDYAKNILETNYCRVLAFADKAKEGMHLYKFDIIAPEKVLLFPFDYILIASTNYHNQIYKFLCDLGIEEEKIKYAEIRSLTASPSVISNLCLEYFIAQREQRKMPETSVSHPIQKMLLESLEQYSVAGILNSAYATKALMDEIKICDQSAVIYPNEDERYFYGLASTLMSYCGFHCKDWNALPSIHHTVLDQRADMYMPAFSPILISTTYHQRYYDIPIIEVGPYIRYAMPSLNQSQTEALKNKLGRTLVAFPMHNDLFWETDYEEEKFNQYLCEEKHHYDSIIICLHMFDLTEEKIQYYNNIGVLPVSLGVRMDQLYLSKLRSLMDLADTVLTNYIGAVLNHATALNKTVTWFEPDNLTLSGVPQMQKIPEFEERKLKLIHSLRHGETLSPEAIACCEDLYRQKIFRSPEEMCAIFEMNEEIYALSHNDRALFKDCMRSYLDKLENSHDPMGILKYRILQESMHNRIMEI